MTKNEKRLVKAIVNYDGDVERTLKHIKEAYGVDAVIEENTITLIAKSINDAAKLVDAENYINETLKDAFVDVNKIL